MDDQKETRRMSPREIEALRVRSRSIAGALARAFAARHDE